MKQVADMSRPGENTPLSLNKGEPRAEEKGKETNSKQPDGDGDQQTGTRCNAQIAASARTPGAQDDECCRARLSEAPVTRSNYGSVDVVSSLQPVFGEQLVVDTPPPCNSTYLVVSVKIHHNCFTHRVYLLLISFRMRTLHLCFRLAIYMPVNIYTFVTIPTDELIDLRITVNF